MQQSAVKVKMKRRRPLLDNHLRDERGNCRDLDRNDRDDDRHGLTTPLMMAMVAWRGRIMTNFYMMLMVDKACMGHFLRIFLLLHRCCLFLVLGHWDLLSLPHRRLPCTC